MAQDPQQINVVVSGGTETQVISSSVSNINVQQGGSTAVSVNQGGATSSSLSTTPGSQVANIGLVGVQGIPGPNEVIPPGMTDNVLLYNNAGELSGIEEYFYYPDTKNLRISGGNLVLDSSSTFVLSGSSTTENAFLIRDASNKNLLKVDTKNKKIILAEDVAANDYKLGVGTGAPQERLHVANGNARVDGDLYMGGDVLPLESGVFSLGSPSKPFKDLYLQGNSIVFVDKDARITASSTGFSFQVTGAGGVYQTLFEANAESLTGVFKGDGAGLTGVPYSGLQDAGVFKQQVVPSGVEFVIVDYQKTLSYDPAVMCSLTPPESNNNAYFTTVDQISRTGCRALFSENISGDNFVLNCHISPTNPVF